MTKTVRALALRSDGKTAGQAAEKLLRDLRGLIDSARTQVARTVDAGLVTLYWNVGRGIRQDILREKRAAYGEEIIQTVSGQLTVLGWGYFL